MIGLLAVVVGGAAPAQPTEPPNGPRRVDPGWHALIHAALVPEAGRKIEDATIVFKAGVIVSVEEKGTPPAGARVWDCTGLTVYPGLVEPYVPVDAPRPDAKAPGTHWNRHVMAQRSALDGTGLDAEARKKLRSLGYVAAALAPKDGILRGMGAVISLAEPGPSSDPLANVVSAKVFHAASLEVNRLAERDYPNSKMGAIALLRQTLADAPWYARALEKHRADPAANPRPAPDDAAAALNLPLPLWFDVTNELDALRSAKIAAEFDRRAVIVGCGTEFRRLDAVAKTGLPIILPLAYPDRPEVTTLADRESVDLRALMTWEAAPTNAARLDRAGATVALTSSKLPKGQEFAANLREAIKAGLSEDAALAMLTTRPAELLGVSHRYGRIAPGMSASLVVVKGSLFDEEREVRDVWIDGVRHEVKPPPRVELEGKWSAAFTLPARTVEGTLVVGKKNEITFERPATDEDRAREQSKKVKSHPGEAKEPAQVEAGEGEKPDNTDAKPETKKFKARSVKADENRLDFVLDGEALFAEGAVLLSAVVETTMIGRGTMPDGSAVSWRAERTEADRNDEEKKEEEKRKKEDAERYTGIPERFGLPFGPFAFDEPPPQREMWIENATIWTCGPAGTIRGGTLHVADGTVKGVYEAGKAPRTGPGRDALRIDAAGRHITPGLIDCHSHTGISGGVNEGTQSCTAEVRIFDVIDPDAIGWYRELAGGLTVVNQLHGSANPIGGQNSVVKIRWGVPHPDEMRLDGAIAGIKFALGENVKQSNWGDRFNTRYPQTRMGVETYIRDRFDAAREYAAKMRQWQALPESARAAAAPPRRDLELEALAEVLAGQRLVHCHSYRQDEVLMLCRVAADFGFTIGTFQHILEGYKVADAVREHSLGGSAFSDWWAYKWEVFDAIPYAGAIMHDAGVTVSFNSDSDELARRMNVEAAKAMKYGNLPAEEALKFVTLNPAKQLKIDGRVGSLEAGKDADFVIWSGDPLSTFSRCEATFIDGREMFSLERDASLRERAKAERRRIIQKLLKQQPEKDKKERGESKDVKPRPPEVVDEPPPFTDLSAGGRGMMLVPVGVDIEAAREWAAKRALERHYEWMIRNGLDPYLSHGGDCGCSAACLIGGN